ncbi:hypothetical protein SKAU_G00334500 [Synaphobranchus kaupii]|uniref:Uncharacterized protein n=1 Tax=Synaphobranchus kaupii TaxID=118154 RepID=A0A9Q1IIX0_SYNKA|nr:hypothetical protein SKAU_G00334500 [Synaphobranchus kaupii]
MHCNTAAVSTPMILPPWYCYINEVLTLASSAVGAPGCRAQRNTRQAALKAYPRPQRLKRRRRARFPLEKERRATADRQRRSAA